MDCATRNHDPDADDDRSGWTLFDPVSLGPLNIRNRIVMAPMTRSQSPGGIPTSQVGDYYARRAHGGVGLIITEGLAIDHPGSVNASGIPNIVADEALAAWGQIVQQVKAEGSAMMAQLWHVGGARSEFPDAPNPTHASVSPSGIYTPGHEFGAPASTSEIADVIDAFARAAEAAMRVGFDGIEIHGAHGYLIDQFLWGLTNVRTDDYGGGLIDRTRFACQVVSECRRRTRDDFPIFFRFSQWKIQDYGARLFADPIELEAFINALIDAGTTAFDCSTRRFWEPAFEGSTLSLAGWTRRLGGIPTMAVGSVGLTSDVVASLKEAEYSSGIGDLARLEEMLAGNEFDLVGVGRALIGDPDWANKVRAGDLASVRRFTLDTLESLV